MEAWNREVEENAEYDWEEVMMQRLQEEGNSDRKAHRRGGGWGWQTYAYFSLVFFIFFWVADLSTGGVVFTAVSNLVSTPEQAPSHDSSSKGGAKTKQAMANPSLRGSLTILHQEQEQASASSKVFLPKDGEEKSSFLATAAGAGMGCTGAFGCGPQASTSGGSSSLSSQDAAAADPPSPVVVWDKAQDIAKKFRERQLAGRAIICLLGGIGNASANESQKTRITETAKKLEESTAADSDRVAFVTGGTEGYPRDEFRKGFTVKARVWSLARGEPLAHPGTTALSLPASDATATEESNRVDKNEQSDVLGYLCDIALVAGGGEGVERSISLMKTRDAPVIPISKSATDLEGVPEEQKSVSNREIYKTAPKWAPAAMWNNRDQPDGIAKLVMSTPKMMAQELRGQLRLPGGATAICFVGGLENNAGLSEAQKASMESFSTSLLDKTAKYGRKVVFVTGWKVNGLFEHFNSIQKLGRSGRLWSVAAPDAGEAPPGGAKLLNLGMGFGGLETDKAAGDTTSRRNRIISEILGGDGLCDILVPMGGGGGTMATIEAAGRRGTPIIPIKGFGGAGDKYLQATQDAPDWAAKEMWDNHARGDEANADAALKLVLNTPQMLARHFRETQIPMGATTICVLGSKQGEVGDEAFLQGVMTKVVEEIDSTGSKVAFVTGGMPGYPQGTAAEVLGNTGRLYNLAMVGSTLPFHSEEATKLEVPAILREREKNVKSTILGELCDVALIAGGGEGTAISLNAMARRKGTYVIPVPGTYAAGAVSEAIISENLKPQWAPAELWKKLGVAQPSVSVEAVANLVVAVPKIAARDVRKQMHFSVKTTVCLVGGAASEAAGKFATKLVDNFPADGAIAFVSGGISGDAAEEAFHKAFLTANPAGRTYYLQTQGKAPASDDKSLDLTSKLGPAFGALEEDKVSREEKDIKSAILGELCDVMLVAGGGPGAIMSVKAAERRSAPVIPLPGTAGNGGYSDQLIAKGEKPQWAPAALWENGKQSVEGAVALVMNTPQMLAHTLRGNGQPFEGKTVLCMLGASKESPEGEESSILTKMGAAAKTVASTTQGMVMIVTGGLADDGVTLAVGKAFPNDDANYKGLVSLKSIEEKLGITDAEKGKQDEKDIKSAFLGQVCDVALVYKGGQGVWITLEAFGRRGGVPVIPMVGSGGAANVLAERPHPDWAPEELWKTEKNEEKLLNGAPPIYAHTIRSKMGATDKTIVCMAGSETGFPVVETRESVLASFVQGLRSTEGHDQKCAYLTGGMSGFPSEPFAKALPGSFALAPQTANLQAAPSEQAVNAITLPEGFKPEGTGNAKELQQEKDIKSAYLGAVCDVVVAAGGGKGTVITKEAMEMRGKAVIELTPGMTEDKARQLGGGLAEPTQPAET